MRGRTRFAALFLAALVAAAWWAMREPPPAPPSGREAPPGFVRGFSLVEYDTGGAIVWSLTAVHAEEEEERVVISEIRLEFPAGETATVLTAPRGVLERVGRDVVLTGGVEMALADGGRVAAETVAWVAAVRRIRAPSPVRFERGGTWAEADAVEVDPKTRLLRSENARGLVLLPGAEAS